MKKIAWITDSTSSLTTLFVNTHDVKVVPIVIGFEDGQYRDGVDITEEAFYEKLEQAKQLPKSSQPSIGEMVEMYEELKKDYDIGIAIHVSSELSGTGNASKKAAEIAGFPLLFVDSRLISYPMGEMILKGKEMIASGVQPEEVAAYLRDIHKRMKLFVTIGSLEQLHKGGRVNTLQLMVGNILQVKPILRIEDGKLVPHEKIRSRKKAVIQLSIYLKEALERGEAIEKVFILQAKSKEDVELLVAMVKELDVNIECIEASLGAGIGVHAGAGTLAIGWFEAE